MEWKMCNPMHEQSEYQKFHYQTSARKATVDTTTKHWKKFLYLCSFYWATQHRLISLLCWDQRHPCPFSEHFCAAYLVTSQPMCRPKDILTLHYYLARLSQKDRKESAFLFFKTMLIVLFRSKDGVCPDSAVVNINATRPVEILWPPLMNLLC